jgi:mercuric ion binding protein
MKGPDMKRLILTTAGVLLLTPGWAAQQSVILSVPGMTCATCPITVKKALTQIDGVIGVKSDLAKRETTVVFDDARVKVDVLTKATTEAGFPSTVATAKP